MPFAAYDFSLNDEQLDKLVKFHNIHKPTYSIFDDENAFKFEESSYVNSNLVPVVEYKIAINKESLHHHRIEWKPYFELYTKMFVHFEGCTTDDVMDSRIRLKIIDKFESLWRNELEKQRDNVMNEKENSQE